MSVVPEYNVSLLPLSPETWNSCTSAAGSNRSLHETVRCTVYPISSLQLSDTLNPNRHFVKYNSYSVLGRILRYGCHFLPNLLRECNPC